MVSGGLDVIGTKQESSRLLVIGLDGGTFDVLRPLVEQGHMPHLGRLLEQGCHGILSSTIPPFTGAAWGSFITGQNPGRHGVIDFRLYDRFNYDAPERGFVSADHLNYTLWEMLSDNGLKVGVLNVPLTYPPRPVNGFMVTGMLTPKGAPQFTFPAGFEEELGLEYMVDVEFVRGNQDEFRRYGFPPREEMLAAIRRMTSTRIKTSVCLLREQPWDFFMVVFTGTDRISHFFWSELVPVLQPAAGDITPLQQQLIDYFQELDAGIGQLLDSAGTGTNVMLMSDHGFGPAPTQRFYANVWLEQLGLLHPRASQGIRDLEYWRVRAGRHKQLKRFLRRLVPEATQSAVKQKTEAVSQTPIVDWSRTRAFFTPIYFHVCGISVNLAGERRHGWVQPGVAYEEVRDRIITAANTLREPLTGRPIVQQAARREELFSGPHVRSFPDIILILDPDFIGAGSLAGSSLVEPHAEPNRTGEHREDGIFVAAGPNIAPRQLLSRLSLVDVTASILYALNAPIVEGIEGKVATAIFRPDFLAAHPIRQQPVPVERIGQRSAMRLSSSEEAELEQRLRGLGYVE